MESEVTCSVCFETYTDPHILKCLHTFCKNCIHNLQKNKNLSCPNCNSSFDVGEAQKDFNKQTLVDYYHSGLFQKLNNLHRCDKCQENKEEFKCICIDCTKGEVKQTQTEPHLTFDSKQTQTDSKMYIDNETQTELYRNYNITVFTELDYCPMKVLPVNSLFNCIVVFKS